MKEHWPKIVIVSLLAIIVGLPIILQPADGSDTVETDENLRLVIFTPHNEQIRFEISNAYNKHRTAQGLAPVTFDWRAPGGTSDIRKSILSQYQAIADRGGDLDQGIGADLFFGGGDYDHGKVGSGVSLKKDGQEIALRIFDDPQLPPELMQEVFPHDRIGGERLYRRYTFIEDEEEREYMAWVGITLSSFGIVYNRDLLTMLDVPEPTVWSDLENPDLLGWVALADPSHSGSIAATFNALLRRQGWTEGWQTLRRIFGNARYFATSADKIPVDVSKGDAAVGMCIDFYGRYQAGMIGGNRVGYTDPVSKNRSMTATTADPITLMRGAPRKALAQEFIYWLLSPEAQGIWQRKKLPGGQSGVSHPDQFELRRQPIRQDLYQAQNRTYWTDPQIDPYQTAVAFPDGTPFFFPIIAPLTQAMAIDTHKDLIEAWKTIQSAKQTNHPNLPQMLELLDQMPEELTLLWPSDALASNWHAIHLDPDHPQHAMVVRTLEAWGDHLGELTAASDVMEVKRIHWRSFFRDNYRKIVQLGAE